MITARKAAVGSETNTMTEKHDKATSTSSLELKNEKKKLRYDFSNDASNYETQASDKSTGVPTYIGDTFDDSYDITDEFGSSVKSISGFNEELASRMRNSWTYVKKELTRLKKGGKKPPSNTTSMMVSATSVEDDQQSVTDLAVVLERDLLEVLNDMEEVKQRHSELSRLEELVSKRDEKQLPPADNQRKVNFEAAYNEINEMLAQIRAVRQDCVTSSNVAANQKPPSGKKVKLSLPNEDRKTMEEFKQRTAKSKEVKLELPDYVTSSMKSSSSFGSDVEKNEQELMEVMKRGDDLVFGDGNQKNKNTIVKPRDQPVVRKDGINSKPKLQPVTKNKKK